MAVNRYPQNDNERRLREQLGLRIDAAVKSVGEMFLAVADLFIAISHPKTDEGVASAKVEPHPLAELMTSEQAAEYLGVKADSLAVWRCTRRYPLPFVKVGRHVRYRKSDLDKFLELRTKQCGREDDSAR